MLLERESISQPFTVRWNGEEVRSNLSLIYKLQEQGVEIPDFEEFETKEDLTSYLKNLDIKVNYMHSDVKALERLEIIRNLRLRRI